MSAAIERQPLPETEFANREETLAHLKKQRPGGLCIYLTEEGKWLDDLVLWELKAAGKLGYRPKTPNCVWSQGEYVVIPELLQPETQA
jgi:hypothetical protein